MESQSTSGLHLLDALAENLIGKHGEKEYVAPGKKDTNQRYTGEQIGVGEWISLIYRGEVDWDLHHQHEWLDAYDETYKESGPYIIYNRKDSGLSVHLDHDESEKHEASHEERWEAMLGLIILDHYFKDQEYEAGKRLRVDEARKLFLSD